MYLFCRMYYEKEIQRLQRLCEEVSTDEEIVGGDSDSEADILEESDHDTNSERSDPDQNDDSSDDDSYDDVPLSQRLDNYVGKSGMLWCKYPPISRVAKTKPANIIRFREGPTNKSKFAVTPLSSWKLFFPDEVIEEIVVCTNIKIQSVRANYTRERDARDTDVIEVRAFMGLLYLAGVSRASHLNLSDLWATDGTGIEYFRCVMTLSRFQFIMRCIRFDNIHDREARKTTDKLAPIRHSFEGFVKRCQENYTIGADTTIDEMLESFRGRCGFRQYIKSKPVRYGIKIFSLADSRSYYTYNMEIYAGKQPDGPFMLNNSPTNVVKRLVGPIMGSGRNITMDNWFTSIDLAQDLLKENLTIVGTIRRNKRELPKEFVDSKEREVKSTIFGFTNNLTLLSYIPKKGKTVALISTMHHQGEVEDDVNRKPKIILYYNKTKGGVDKVDEMKGSYSVSRKTARWPLTIFFCEMNIAGINSQVIYEFNTKANLKRREFLRSLAKELCSEHIHRRLTMDIPLNIRTSIHNVLRIPVPPTSRADSPVGRCGYCSSKKNRKTTTTCQTCSRYICKEHRVDICVRCLGNEEY